MKNTTSQATETTKTAHTPLCHIEGNCFDMCRCAMFAKTRAEIAAVPRLTFKGPIGKSVNPRREPIKTRA